MKFSEGNLPLNISSALAGVKRQGLGYFDFAFQVGEAFFLLLLSCFGVDIHGRFDIGVSHDLLNDLDVAFVFAKACTESVAQVVNRKVADQQWFTTFLVSQYKLVLVVVSVDPFDCPIDIMGGKRISISILKNKSCVAVND